MATNINSSRAALRPAPRQISSTRSARPPVRPAGTPPPESAIEAPQRRVARRVPVNQEIAGSISTTVSAEHHRKQVRDEAREDATPTRRFAHDQHPAFVRVNVGRTHNLGDYSSLRIDVSVTLPCLPEEVGLAYEEASMLVHEKMAEEEMNQLGRPSASQRTANRRG